MWILVFILLSGNAFPHVGFSKFETGEECAAELIEWEAREAGPRVTNWHGVCLPIEREPADKKIRV